MNKIKKIIKKVFSLIFPAPVVKVEITCLSANELLKGRTALITGGTSGIGFQIARSYLNSECKVIITGRSQERLDIAYNKLVSENPDWKNRLFSCEMDVSNISSIKSIFKQLVNKVGQIDILVNNAGVDYGHINNCTEEKFDEIINTNIKGLFFLSREVSSYMIRNNIKGNILNVCSSCSILPANSAYSISKWSVRGFTEGLARMLIPHHIVVNGIAPGMTATPLVNKEDSNDDLYLENSLEKRYAVPEEISNMAVVLVSNMSRMVVGDIVYMTGGSGIIYQEDVNYNFDFDLNIME